MKFAVGGFLHETNTFVPSPTELAHFRELSSIGSQYGPEEILASCDINFEHAGFINAISNYGHQIQPLLLADAEPGGKVSDDAFETITGELVASLQSVASDIDGLCLVLHGAMVTASHDDGETEILRRVRSVVGPELPIVVTLDLHGNVSDAMVELADVLIGFREFPHTDMAQIGREAAHVMMQIVSDPTVFKRRVPIDFLIPANRQGTFDGPMKEVYDVCARTEAMMPGVLSMSVLPGFNSADVEFAGPTVLAYARSEQAVDQASRLVAENLNARECDFIGELFSPEEAAAEVVAHRDAKPIVIADVQDNPGGGAWGDTVEAIAALVRADAQDVVAGMLYDPQSADQAHQAGEGAEIELKLGGQHTPHAASLSGTFVVERLSSDIVELTGVMAGGLEVDMGRMALLRIGGVRVIVASNRTQCLDLGMIRCMGIEPLDQRAILVKSTLHYRADFDGVCSRRIDVRTPGMYRMDPRENDYKKLRSNVRRYPGAA